MSKRTTKLGIGIAALVVASQANAQTFFIDDFNEAYSPDRFLTATSQVTQFMQDNPSVYNLTFPEQRDAYPWTWVKSVPSSTGMSIGVANSAFSINTAAGIQSGGAGFFTHHNNTDFNFFGPANADPATFRRVFRANGITIEGDGHRNAAGEYIFPGTPLSDSYYVMYFSVVSGQGYQSTGNTWEVPGFSAWIDKSRKFGVGVRQYAAANSLYATKTDLLADVVGANLPRVPTDIEIELGPETYKVTFFFPGGGMFLNGQHGMTKADWGHHSYDPTDPNSKFYEANYDAENPGNFYVGIAAASALEQYANTTISVDSVTITDGQP